jgi:hypothetical protein
MTISLKSYYRGTLVIPILLPIVTLPFELGIVSTILLLTLWFSGLPYLLFAILTYVWIGRMSHPERLVQLMWVTPLVFLPFSIMGYLLIQSIMGASIFSSKVGVAELLPISVYSLAIGYAYVILVQVLFLLLDRLDVFE